MNLPQSQHRPRRSTRRAGSISVENAGSPAGAASPSARRARILVSGPAASVPVTIVSGYNVVLHADPEVPASPMSQVHSTGCLGPHEYAPGPRARPSIDARASPVTFGTFRAGVSEGSPCPQPDGVLHEGPVSPRGSGGMDIFDMLSDGPCEK